MTNELLELVPTHERALGNRAYYQKEIQSKASQSKKKRGEDGQDDTAVPEQVRRLEKLNKVRSMIWNGDLKQFAWKQFAWKQIFSI